MLFDTRIFAFFVLIALILGCVEFVRRIEKRRSETARIWQIVRYQGGANVYTPHAMIETKAIEFSSVLGTVMHVDRERGFIFIRSS